MTLFELVVARCHWALGERGRSFAAFGRKGGRSIGPPGSVWFGRV